MSKKEKALEKLRQNPKNVRFEHLVTILIALGFEVREGGKGSHIVVKAPGKSPVTIPRKKPFIKPIYVKFALELIDALTENDG